MQLLVPWIVALVPLLIAPGLLFHFDITPKVVVFLLGVCCALYLFCKNPRELESLLAVRAGRVLSILLLTLWLCTAASTLFSTWPALSLTGSIWRRKGLITETAVTAFTLLAASWLLQNRNNLPRLLRAICVSGVLISTYGIAQYFGFDPFIPPTAYQAGEGAFTIVRPPGTLGHADYFGAWLLFVVFAGAVLVRAGSKWLGWLACALGSLAILVSGTRAALLGLVVGAGVLLVLTRFRGSRRNFAAAAAVLIGVVGLIVSPPGAKLRARLRWSREDARGGARLLLWRDSLHMIGARPVLGFGPDTFATAFPRFQSIDLARSYPDFYQESPHNALLDVTVDDGILTGSVFVLLCGFALYWARDALRRRIQIAGPLCAGLVAALVCHQFSVFTLSTELYFYLWTAAIVSTAATVPPPQAARTPALFPRLVAILLTCVFGVFGISLFVADGNLAIAEKRIAAGDPRRAAAARETALRWSPPGSSSDLTYSLQMAALAARTTVFQIRAEASSQALMAGINATRTAEDRQNAWFNLAMLLAGAGDANGVERSLRTTILWAPNWFKPHWILAQLLQKSGRHDEALKEAEFAAFADAGKHPEVGATLTLVRAKK